MITQLLNANVATGFVLLGLILEVGLTVCHFPYFFLFLNNAPGRLFATSYGLFLQSYMKGH